MAVYVLAPVVPVAERRVVRAAALVLAVRTALRLVPLAAVGYGLATYQPSADPPVSRTQAALGSAYPFAELDGTAATVLGSLVGSPFAGWLVGYVAVTLLYAAATVAVWRGTPVLGGRYHLTLVALVVGAGYHVLTLFGFLPDALATGDLVLAGWVLGLATVGVATALLFRTDAVYWRVTPDRR